MRERELKLAVNATFMLPDLTDTELGVLELRDLPELDLVSIYHDTPDLRLARAGVTLRYRTGEEEGPVWTLKLRVPGSDGTVRDELSFPGQPSIIPLEALDLVTALSRSSTLGPVARLRTRRRQWLLYGGGERELALLVDDEVTVLNGKRVVARFRELELESRGPELEQLIPIAERLQLAGAVLAEPVPKAVRAMGPKASAPPDFAPIDAGPTDPAGVAVQAAMAAGGIRLVQHDPGTRLGEVEPLHQMRVATRRLRSDLRTFAPLVDASWARGLADELGWLGDYLGAVRDLDVQVARFESDAEDLRADLEPLFDLLRERREAARAALLDALRGERYAGLLDRLVDAAREPILTDAAGQPAEQILPPLLRKAWERLEVKASRLEAEDPDERYHEVRILAKRARYAAEATGPVLGQRGIRARKFAAEAAALQDLLGSLQDGVVGSRLIREAVEGSHGARFSIAAGRLVEREQIARQRVRVGYPRVWRRLARRGGRLVES